MYLITERSFTKFRNKEMHISDKCLYNVYDTDHMSPTYLINFLLGTCHMYTYIHHMYDD